MILCGLLGMSTKFVECTLGVKYRDIGEDGTVYGGPMYYLTKGLKERGFVTLGKILAGIFAFFMYWRFIWWGECRPIQPSSHAIGRFFWNDRRQCTNNYRNYHDGCCRDHHHWWNQANCCCY